MLQRSAPVTFGSLDVRLPTAPAGSAIGLLGGSFNPPHGGHRLISLTAMARLNLDAVWWMASPGNPLKSTADLKALDDRLQAAQELASHPRIQVTGFEAEMASPYTAATLMFLRKRQPTTRFVWLMGADNLAGFHRWQQWRDIFRLVPIAIMDRPGWRLSAMASPAAHAFRRAYIPEQKATRLAYLRTPAWTFVTGQLSYLSSTMIRNADPNWHRLLSEPRARLQEICD